MAYRYVYTVEVRHEGLGKYRQIRGSEQHVVEQKAKSQMQQWDEQWQRKVDIERAAIKKTIEANERIQEKERVREQTALEKRQQKEETQRYLDARKQDATDRTTAAKNTLENLRNTLIYTLGVNDAIDWERLKDKALFKEPLPQLTLPATPEYSILPIKPVNVPLPIKSEDLIKSYAPQKDSWKYQPNFGFLDRFIPAFKNRKLIAMQALFESDHAAWVIDCGKIDQKNIERLNLWLITKKSIEESNIHRHSEWEKSVELTNTENSGKKKWWEKSCETARNNHTNGLSEWEKRKIKFLQSQAETNSAIEENREKYLAQDPGAIADYCDSVLSNSTYPDSFPKEWDLDYSAETRTIVIEYALPSPEAIQTLKDVQYVQSRDEFKETHISEKERDALYDSLLYQVALRTIHEIFEADICNALDALVFNGLVTAVNKTSGHEVTACVLSVLARKEAFMQINLANIDPKACFKSLKGVAASTLVGLTPIPPILIINKEDRRFVDSYAVADSIDSETNLAAMDWEDFEHLIRELFEKEFSTSGGEVKVTQASRDGGVDAIAFDPDPIRGGKIVIQAKRYTNVVGVSAVRDLYGTVINEGATKGVLVTTANYGPDAYEFAKGKPLSLLSGSNLLHLLEKHGHKARINIQEAKLLAAQI